MDQQKQQLVDRIKQAQNVLVTVSANPSVDQLAAAIGLTIALNKFDKHGTAVFSGEVPSTIDFLKPEETLEKDTNSLRDFIIALDKSKADKLRYKVEDQVVRIFITPYKTSLSEQDLQFSQGDFNVDVVVALGVADQQELDAAIVSHGRILHDATVASVSLSGQGSLGTLNWVDPGASSLSEMVVNLVDSLDKKILDGQIATALLTGIVASTERFSNEKTTPKTMSASAELMAAGANQQLIATELATPAEPEPDSAGAASEAQGGGNAPAEPPKEPGTLEIDHESTSGPAPAVELEDAKSKESKDPQIHVDEEGRLLTETDGPLPQIGQVHTGESGTPPPTGASENHHELLSGPPQLAASDITASSSPEGLEPSAEELTLPPVNGPMLSHSQTMLTPSGPPPADTIGAPAVPLSAAEQAMFTPAPAPPAVPESPVAVPATPATAAGQTLSDLEKQFDSPHMDAGATPAPGGVDTARNAVEQALQTNSSSGLPQPPIAALNAQPLGPDLRSNPVPNTGFSEPSPGNTPASASMDFPSLSANPPVPSPAPPSTFPGATPQTGSSAPPVPPPFVPPAP